MFSAARAVSKIYPLRGIYALRVNHYLGYSFSRHLRRELVRSEGLPDSNYLMYSEDALKATAASMGVFFARVLAMAASEVIGSAEVSVSVLGLDFVKFNVFFRNSFLAFTLDWPDARDPVSLISCIGERVTLKGFFIESNLEMPFPSL